MSRQQPVGIDLGTAFSAAAWVDQSGHTALVHNSEGELRTPSAVLFADAEVVVGKEAHSAVAVRPGLVAQGAMRDLGAAYCATSIRGKKAPPEVIQACILRKLKADIAAALGSDGPAVIAVPGCFDGRRRQAVADAAEMAGLKVLDIVNQPTAAALAFRENLGHSTGGVAHDETTLLVFDLGAGTFDAALLRLGPESVQTIATDGDANLGGYDWDMRLAEYVAIQFQTAHGGDPRKDPAAMSRILSAAVEAKHTLSARSHAVVRVELAGRMLEVPVTRTQFEKMAGDLMERVARIAQRLLAAANMEWKDVSRLLLVGGATRMPMVVNHLRAMSRREPDQTLNPDDAVARGAALYAAHLLAQESRGGEPASGTVINVSSHSLGIEKTAADGRRRNVILIPRNMPLPMKVSERFPTISENQRSMDLPIFESDGSVPAKRTGLGRIVIRDLPEGLPKDWPVEVTLAYGASGCLSICGAESGARRAGTVEWQRAGGMSSEVIAQWKQIIAKSAGFSAFEAMMPDAEPEPAVEEVLQRPAAESVLEETSPEPASASIVGETSPQPAFESMIRDALEASGFESQIKELLELHGPVARAAGADSAARAGAARRADHGCATAERLGAVCECSATAAGFLRADGNANEDRRQ